MSNLASALKDEIRRLARREAKAQVDELRSATARYRKEFADLKRQFREQERLIARLQKQSTNDAPVVSTGEDDRQVRFSPDWVAKHREKLELSAADYAALVGVSMLTIYNWEKGKSRPQKRQLEAWAAVRKLGKREAWARLEELEAS